MKKNFLFAMAMAAVFAGCSSDDDGVSQSNSMWNENGEGYVSLSINLPTQPTTRANDVFNDGLKSEYNVSDATLILFSGDSEAEATFASAYQLQTSWTDKDPNTDQITTQAQVTQKIKSATGNIYALVVLNGNNLLTVGSDNTLIINEVNMATKKISDLTTLELESKNITSKNILMMNSPFAVAPGKVSEPSSTDVNILVHLTADMIKPTAVEAEANPADIYVERAVAKTTFNKGSVEKVGSTALNFAVEGWTLDHTNKKMYFMRNTTGAETFMKYASGASVADKYRFVGSTEVEDGTGFGNNKYRIYWAIDPNYDSPADEFANYTEFSTAYGNTNPQYCYENTFNVANQTYQNTTRVLVKAKIGDGSNFYTYNGGNTTYTEDNMLKKFKAEYIARPEVATWFTENAKDASVEFGENDFDLTIDVDATTKRVTVTDITLSSDGEADMMPVYVLPPKDAELLAILNQNEVYKYEGGIAYYPVLIRHFDDTQAPWGTWETTDIPTAGNSYPGTNNEANYLGRYGMVRNNWYDLTITAVNKIGYASVPSINTDTTPDDNIESFISVKINILSWAKRSQNVEL